LYDRLEEYGGIGGRVAGARHPFKIPQPQVRTRKDMTPEMVEKAKRRLEMRAKTREYLRQIALGEAWRKRVGQTTTLSEAKLDAGKMKVMAKNLMDLFDKAGTTNRLQQADYFKETGYFKALIKKMDETGDLSSFEAGRLIWIFGFTVDEAKGTPLHKKAVAYHEGLKRMKGLIEKEEGKEKAAVRERKKAKLNKSLLKKGSVLHAFKKGKEIVGTIKWVGPNKFKKGEMSYGIATGGKKLEYISLYQIFDVTPAPKAHKSSWRDDGDFWVDAGKDMAAELGHKPYKYNYSKKRIRKHFGWK
jgi:hypothetical protein